MVDSLNNLISGRPADTSRSSGYQSDSLREVKSRAAVSRPDHNQEETSRLRRLNAVLSNEQPLRDDVPRGYYLNIKV